MLRWCEKKNADYLVGLAKNAWLKAMLPLWIERVEAKYRSTQEKVRLNARQI